jgi:DNA replicative helicase MCM subunit Mcm2 (Cdc46/Mcm family)
MVGWKSIVLMIVLVAIGFAGGFFTQRILAQRHIERVIEVGTPRGMADHLFHMIDADEEQRKQLTPIIDGYANKVHQETRTYREMRRSLMDSLRTEINPFLKEDQKEKLQEFFVHLRHRTKKKIKKHGKKTHRRMSKE